MTVGVGNFSKYWQCVALHSPPWNIGLTLTKMFPILKTFFVAAEIFLSLFATNHPRNCHSAAPVSQSNINAFLFLSSEQRIYSSSHFSSRPVPCVERLQKVKACNGNGCRCWIEKETITKKWRENGKMLAWPMMGTIPCNTTQWLIMYTTYERKKLSNFRCHQNSSLPYKTTQYHANSYGSISYFLMDGSFGANN